MDFKKNFSELTTVDKVKLCALFMGIKFKIAPSNQDQHLIRTNDVSKSYWPVTNDDQMLALAKHANLVLDFKSNVVTDTDIISTTQDVNINLAVVNSVSYYMFEKLGDM